MRNKPKMVPNLPPAPEGQQGPPMRAAASDSRRSLRSAHGSLPLTSGTASRRRKNNKPIRRIDNDSWQKGYAAGRAGTAYHDARDAAGKLACGWSWDCGYLLGEHYVLRVADATRKLDTNSEH